MHYSRPQRRAKGYTAGWAGLPGRTAQVCTTVLDVVYVNAMKVGTSEVGVIKVRTQQVATTKFGMI